MGLLDFDYAAPGRALWDVAMAARMWVPLAAPEKSAATGRGHADPATRLRAFCDAYGISSDERRHLLEVVVHTDDVGAAFVRRHVEAADPGFVALWRDHAGDGRYAATRRWLADNASALTKALVD